MFPDVRFGLVEIALETHFVMLSRSRFRRDVGRTLLGVDTR